MALHIAFTGPICSGKTTLAQALCRHHGFRCLSLAAPLKLLAECARHGAHEYARLLLDSLRPAEVELGPCLDAYWRAVAVHQGELSAAGKPRSFLQQLGADLRSIAPDIFTFALLKRARFEHTNLVCDDVRLPNEVRLLTAAGWKLVRVECDERVRLRRVAELYPNITPEQLNHPSEGTLSGVHFDYTIVTDDLRVRVEDLVLPLVVGALHQPHGEVADYGRYS